MQAKTIHTSTSIRTSELNDLPERDDRERNLKMRVRNCFQIIATYEETRKELHGEPEKPILAFIQETLINLLSFVDPEANSQLGIAMELMRIHVGQINQVYPVDKVVWYQAAWLLLWKTYEIQGELGTQQILLRR